MRVTSESACFVPVWLTVLVPVNAPFGWLPTSPRSVVAPELVTPVAARMTKGAAVPSGTPPGAACARATVELRSTEPTATAAPMAIVRARRG